VKQWFDGLPVHRKLVAMALVVSTAALLAAATGLMGLDVWRYRTSAQDDAETLARIIADNSAAAVTFGDQPAAQDTLFTVRVRPAVTRACIYLPDGQLFAQYARSADAPCPAAAPSSGRSFSLFGAVVPIVRNNRTWGSVYVERDLSDLGPRLAVTAAAAAAMLLLAGGLAFVLAQRLTRTVSQPITELARVAKQVGDNLRFEVPEIATPQDEIGDLVRVFRAMMIRVRDSNEGLVREIDERKRIEAERETLLVREREASRLKDQFLAAVSHELRTPLNAILGWVQILGSTKPSEQTSAKAIASIARNAQAQTRVIEDLVDVSRIVAGKLHLRFEPVDLREPIEAAVEVVRLAAHSKNIDVVVQSPDRPCLINGDRDRLQQVVWNLLSNAVKFTGAGGRVTIRTEELDGTYQLEVSDSGVGIAPEFLPYVFDRFRQADGSMTREHGGLGLGLAIVKDLTEMHGGTVDVLSPGQGHGTTFTVRFPALIGLQPAVGPIPENDVIDSAELAGVRVLAVDDNVDALEVMSLALTAAGATVRAVTSGTSAVQEWEREPADVLLCDLAMPGMDGFDVLREIRQRDGRNGHATRAVAVSAHATRLHRDHSRKAGFAQHVAKPYRTADLVRAVSAALKNGAIEEA
jgi:signal transduction histidine kinase/ActR/RegA family two-component response regulator